MFKRKINKNKQIKKNKHKFHCNASKFSSDFPSKSFDEN